MPEYGPATCAGCGLLCDDVTVENSGDRVWLSPACGLGAEWFAGRTRACAGAPAATLDGEPTDAESALARVVEMLKRARRPLVRGFENATIEDARAAVALADRLGALVSTDAAVGPWPGAPAFPLRGASSATLGEIRDRSRVVVIWREDPETTHPRLLERLGFGGDASDRALVVVDNRDTATAQKADERLTWPQDRDLEALTSLHMMKRGLPVAHPAADPRRLITRLESVPHATFVYGGGLTAGAGGQRRALALHELVRALCHERHVVTLELPVAAGTRGAGDVLAWQSGYAGTVDFAPGHPELVTATEPLEDVDLTLAVESGPGGCTVAASGVEVWIRTAAAGTVHRLDGVPLSLESQPSDTAPTAAALLTRLLAEVGA